jgi:hypothetical protein
MAKRDAFTAGGLRIETWFDGERHFICWKPDVSVYRRTRKEVLKFAAWPAKTPTGDSLRAWLTSLEDMDEKRAIIDTSESAPSPERTTDAD